MASAEIITIGTEILLGEIVDTNAQHIARALRDVGINLYRKTTVGDNTGRIAQVIQEALARSDIIITTGGLGPTVDDPTRQAVAQAVGVELEYRPELWEQIEARFRRYDRLPTENNRRQAFIPKGAIPLENPVGTAPCFIIEREKRSIICLPGVPREMEHLMEHDVIPYLKQRYEVRGVIKSLLVHTAGVGESQIDDLIGDLEQLSNPTVGLAAHSGQVDVRIAARADSQIEADAMIQDVEKELRRRLGDWIYGTGQDSLETIALQGLVKRGWGLVVIEAGLNGELVRRLAIPGGPFRAGEVLTFVPDPQELLALTSAYRQAKGAEVALGVSINPGGEKQDVNLVLISPEGEQQVARPYGGAPANAVRYAVNHCLNLLRSR